MVKMHKNITDKKFEVAEIYYILNCKPTYKKFVSYLNCKYGAVGNSYFHEESYKNHFRKNGPGNKQIKRYYKSCKKCKECKNRKNCKACENCEGCKDCAWCKKGLYVHHVAEDKFQNLSNVSAIEKIDFGNSQDYGFEYQKSNQLVYCNLIEHTLLHLFIMKSDNTKEAGYKSLIGKIKKWFIEKEISSSETEFYNASKINEKEAKNLIARFDEFKKA